MTIWRPQSSILVKALGLNWRGNQLLAAQVLDDTGHVKGVRPLGGAVEFGETTEVAVIREFKEELGIAVKTIGPPIFMENLYLHQGVQGHEIIAMFNVVFLSDVYAGETRIEFNESNGLKCFAEWFNIEELDLPDRLQLFPVGLKDVLLRR
jgi:8-oxo-dGTP pyrophosphatase MutT (NUDIX family)